MFQKPRRKVDKVFIHCSAASRKNITAKEIDRWHKQRGWSGIGYHYFIRTNGKLEEGRDISKTPAAQAGHNRGTIAICLNGLNDEDFTNEQYNTLMKLCQDINNAYDKKLTFHGHCEVSAKTCPVFNYKRILKLSRTGRLGI